MRQHQTKIIDSIDYEREDNINAVQTWFGDRNGVDFLYDPDSNEYFVLTRVGMEMCRRGDTIAKDSDGWFRVLKPFHDRKSTAQ